SSQKEPLLTGVQHLKEAESIFIEYIKETKMEDTCVKRHRYYEAENNASQEAIETRYKSRQGSPPVSFQIVVHSF
ncbi:unnamed protein product, partial [Heterotrigona itama]